jgi:hypothetical protein
MNRRNIVLVKKYYKSQFKLVLYITLGLIVASLILKLFGYD